jgi:hypothetical protein
MQKSPDIPGTRAIPDGHPTTSGGWDQPSGGTVSSISKDPFIRGTAGGAGGGGGGAGGAAAAAAGAFEGRASTGVAGVPDACSSRVQATTFKPTPQNHSRRIATR